MKYTKEERHINEPHQNYHPRLNEKQSSFAQALTSMLNTARYLESAGFHEIDDPEKSGKDHYFRPEIIGIGNGSGKIIFPKGYICDHLMFIYANDRDKILEDAITEGASYHVPLRHKRSATDNVIRQTYQKDDCFASLMVIDTKNTKNHFDNDKNLVGYLKDMAWSALNKQESFSFGYVIGCDSGKERPESYIQGIEDAMKKESLVRYSEKK